MIGARETRGDRRGERKQEDRRKEWARTEGWGCE